MSRERGSVLGVLASAYVAVLSGACGREAQQVEWETSDTLPDNFPKDIPVYPTAKLMKVVHAKGEPGSIIVWHAPDRVSAVREFYAPELAAKVTTPPGVSAPWMGEGGVTVIATGWGQQLSFALGELGEGGEQTAITAAMPRL